jgi:two-component system nitrate/nitrite response regulator NarL
VSTEGERVAGAGAVSVAIVDDHRLLSAALQVTLESNGFRVVVPELTQISELMQALAAARPSVVLLDLDLGALGSGEDLLPELVQSGPRVIVMSGTADDMTAGRCLAAGAWSFVTKSAEFEGLLGAVRDAAAGLPAASAERQRLLRAWREGRNAASETLKPFELLTQREAAVLAMLCSGLTVERIALDSFVSEATVRTQVRAILSKLNVHSQLEAVAKANRSGWKAPDT